MSEEELNERLSRRFGGEEETKQEGTGETSQNKGGAQPSQKSRRAQNIKKEWNVRSFYLSDELDDDLTTAYKRLDLDLAEEGDFDELRKTRHFYPLVVALGLERLESMDVTEVTEHIEGEDFK